MHPRTKAGRQQQFEYVPRLVLHFLAIGISHPPAFLPVPWKVLRVRRSPLPDKPVASGPHPRCPLSPRPGETHGSPCRRSAVPTSLAEILATSILTPPFPTHTHRLYYFFFSNKLSLQDIWEAMQLPMPCAREGSQPRAHREEEKEEEEGSSAVLHTHPAAPKSTTPNLLPV